MTSDERDYKKRYDELMRNAGKARRKAAEARLSALKRGRQTLNRKRREAKAQRDTAMARAVRKIDDLIEALDAKIAREPSVEERIYLKAERAKLMQIRTRFTPKRRRRPPESGLPVPAIPPSGPRPKQGGAAAPLDFDA